jgi:hypothetical protein
MDPRTENIASEPSWVIENNEVQVALTIRGGHMAPVTFFRNSAEPVRPYYINPWNSERIPHLEPVLVPLRGDFFCMPFGGESIVKGVRFPTHGDPATAAWQAGGVEQSPGHTQAAFTMSTSAPKGRITKTLLLVRGHNAVYIRHVLEGFDGRAPLGHHATLAGSDEQDSLLISTSPLRFGMVAPRPPDTFVSGGEYNALRGGAAFRSLDKVPTIWKDMPLDTCASFPRRTGFCDIIQVYNKPGDDPAWVTAVNPSQGWLWFALKDPSVLPSTLLWMENHGRHGAPWNGRNCCIGLEDVCAFFAGGLSRSLKRNELNKRGVATTARLSAGKPLAVNYIQGVARAPKGFGRVRTVRFGDGMAVFAGETGKTVRAAVDYRFISSGTVGD